LKAQCQGVTEAARRKRAGLVVAFSNMFGQFLCYVLLLLLLGLVPSKVPAVGFLDPSIATSREAQDELLATLFVGALGGDHIEVVGMEPKDA
jgi:hypothetical protein